MTKQSISFTTPNNNWLNAQVESEEYTSKSDVVNDLIQSQLIKAEQGGFTN